MRFLLDEDVNPTVATVAAGPDIDVVSVHELGRLGWSDEQQLESDASDGRILVTRNRDDFLALGRAFYAAGRPFPGILILSTSLPNRRPEAVAHALSRWVNAHGASDPGPGFLDFLTPP